MVFVKFMLDMPCHELRPVLDSTWMSFTGCTLDQLGCWLRVGQWASFLSLEVADVVGQRSVHPFRWSCLMVPAVTLSRIFWLQNLTARMVWWLSLGL